MQIWGKLCVESTNTQKKLSKTCFFHGTLIDELAENSEKENVKLRPAQKEEDVNQLCKIFVFPFLYL